MATLKVTFVFTTDWTAAGNNFAVADQLKNTLTNAQAYNIVRDSKAREHTVAFDVTVVGNANATTKLVKQELQAFIDAVEAYNVTVDVTHNLFNVAYKPSQNLANFNTMH